MIKLKNYLRFAFVRVLIAVVRSKAGVWAMSEADIAVILNRLDQLEETLKEVHREVKRTNGRVTDLEMADARSQGQEKAKEMQRVIFTSVLSGAVLAGVIWGISYLAA